MEPIGQVVVDNIMDSMPAGLMVINPKGEVVVVNSKMVEILGFSKESLMEKSWGELLFSQERNSEFNQVIIDVISQELVNLKRCVPYVNAANGRTLRLTVTSSYLTSGGEMAGVVVLISDETQEFIRNQREKALLSENNQLHRERAEGLRKLAMSVAHQIRNPAMTIGGFTNMLLREKEIPQEVRTKLEVVMNETRKLEGMVKAVTDFAAMPQAMREVVSAPALIESLRLELDSQAVAVDREVACSVECGLVEISADPGMIKRALDAVLLNALEFSSGDKAKISLKAHSGEDGVRIAITDQGIGIPAANLPYVFDPFFTTKPGGVGMGLTVAKRIVLEHQGEITLESEEGAWTRAAIFIPSIDRAGGEI